MSDSLALMAFGLVLASMLVVVGRASILYFLVPRLGSC